MLTLGFTAKPVRFRIDRGIIRVRKKHDEAKPRIYFDGIKGAMLEPSPLPKPIPIAFAKGIVRLEGRPMVDLVARTCLGASELRVRGMVPARKKPVELTADSAGLGAALGKMGLSIAAKKKADKIQYQEGPVKIEGGLEEARAVRISERCVVQIYRNFSNYLNREHDRPAPE